MMLMLALAGLAAAPAQAAPPPPKIAAYLFVTDADGQRGGRRAQTLADSSTALLVTLDDLGAIKLHDPLQPASDFAACFGPKRSGSWEPATARCLASAIKPRGDGVRPIAILVNDTHSRSSAQQFTCAGAPDAVGEARLHLADLFHPRRDIRAGVRIQAMECIRGAIGGPR